MDRLPPLKTMSAPAGPFHWPDVRQGRVSKWLRSRFGSVGSDLAALADHKSRAPAAAVPPQAGEPLETNTSPSAPSSTVTKQVDPNLRYIFDDFELGEQLGKGASSVVFRAHAKGGISSSEHQYAVKVITLDENFSEADAADEYSLQQRLSDPRVATALGAYRGDPGKYYLLFELMEGGSLKELVPAGVLPEEDVQRIMARIFGALASLHKEKVIHCDVKMENLMLHAAGDVSSVRLIDFGLCHDMKKRSWASKASGTPPYFAPELARVFRGECDAVFGQHVDVWAAGVVMYELLSGEKPFNGQDFETLFRQIDEQPVLMVGAAWAGVSAEAKSLVRRCLARDFHFRISAREATRHPWLLPYHEKRPSISSSSPMDIVKKIMGRRSTQPGGREALGMRHSV
eukprot:jgi/Tetstr1/432881/TSEL_022230.t1